MNPTRLSIRAYAKLIDVSEGAVRKAINKNKFGEGYDEATKTIDPEVAKNNVWVQQQLIVKPKAGISKAKATGKAKEAFPDPKWKAGVGPDKKYIDNPDAEPESVTEYGKEIEFNGENIDTVALLNSIKVNTSMPVSQVMKMRELIGLALDKKKLEELDGVLVQKEKVERALFTIASEMKKALLNVPQKVVREIQVAKSEVEGIALLTTALNEILFDFGKLKPGSL